MTELRVFDVSASGRRVALHESRNVYHVALAPLESLSIHHRVRGETVDVGLCTMYDMDAHRPVALVFEQTGCTLWEALDLLEEH
jgi:hypothetical protein